MNIQHMMANSYRNFHARGLDYLCLLRTPELTLKAYFFDGPQSDLAHLPEIVAPHDHRYSFDTHVVRGRVANIIFHETEEGMSGARAYQKFNWLTPLLGGSGFSHAGATWLAPHLMFERDRWHSRNTEIHTLRVLEEGSVIILRQFADVVPVGVPTTTYTLGADPQPPSLSGLYDEMDEDVVAQRYAQLEALVPNLREMAAMPGTTP